MSAGQRYQEPYPVTQASGKKIIWDWNVRDWVPYVPPDPKAAPPATPATPPLHGESGPDPGSGEASGGGAGGGSQGGGGTDPGGIGLAQVPKAPVARRPAPRRRSVALTSPPGTSLLTPWEGGR